MRLLIDAEKVVRGKPAACECCRFVHPQAVVMANGAVLCFECAFGALEVYTAELLERERRREEGIDACDGCGREATTRDGDGVPLCGECVKELEEEGIEA